MLYAQAALAAAATAILATRGIEAEPGIDAWIGLGQIASFVAGAAAILLWIHRASCNARALGARDMIVSPGWAVGWWFVPLANLIMPFMTLRELWKASAAPSDWETERAPVLLGLWWGLWLLSGFTGIVSFQLIWAGGKEAYSAGMTALVVSDVSYVPAAILFAYLIVRIEAMQRRQRAAAPVSRGAIAEQLPHG